MALEMDDNLDKLSEAIEALGHEIHTIGAAIDRVTPAERIGLENQIDILKQRQQALMTQVHARRRGEPAGCSDDACKAQADELANLRSAVRQVARRVDQRSAAP